MPGWTLIFLILALAAGCKPSNPADNPPAAGGTNSAMSLTNAWQQTKTTASNAWVDAKEGATNAWANTKEAATAAWVDIKQKLGPAEDYTYDKKDEFTANASADLEVMDQKIQELSDRAAKVSESAKEDAQVKLQEVRNQRASLDQKLNDVKNASEANWNDAKAAFKNSYNEAQNSIKQAWQWLSDKLTS